jgi:hypothetical protein
MVSAGERHCALTGCHADSFAMLGLGGSNVTLDDSSIAWPVDVSDKFHEPQLSVEYAVRKFVSKHTVCDRAT